MIIYSTTTQILQDFSISWGNNLRSIGSARALPTWGKARYLQLLANIKNQITTIAEGAALTLY